MGFDTTSGASNVVAAEYLAGELERHGCRVMLQRYTRAGVAKANVVAVAGPPAAGGLVLSGHLDTVPFAGQPGWTRDPLALTTDGDRVYGRGTTDMKIFIAQCADAAARLDRETLRRPLVLLFTADEEVGCLGAAELARELPRLLGDTPVPGLAWIGEPTGWDVFHAHKSVAIFEVRVRGRGGHSGLPEQGVNAIAVAAKAIEEVGRYQTDLRARPSAAHTAAFPECPYTTLNLGTIRGGSAANVIADECCFTASSRTLPGEDPLGPYREIARRLGTLDARDPGSGGRAEIVVGEPLYVPSFEAPRGTRLEQALFDVLGRTTSGGALLAADGCRFAEAGIQSLICGPGDFDQAHQPDESISRAEFERGSEIILQVIERLLGGRFTH
ncbi:MAG: acetylornithine deacetylase [Candidatus Binatota bacterium]|nr:acetylornithine deacetylase [Candidatus Binatota bacterium]